MPEKQKINFFWPKLLRSRPGPLPTERLVNPGVRSLLVLERGENLLRWPLLDVLEVNVVHVLTGHPPEYSPGNQYSSYCEHFLVYQIEREIMAYLTTQLSWSCLSLQTKLLSAESTKIDNRLIDFENLFQIMTKKLSLHFLRITRKQWDRCCLYKPARTWQLKMSWTAHSKPLGINTSKTAIRV